MKNTSPLPLIPLTALAAMLMTGCIHTTSEIKPIHITMDINLKVDRALDNYFSDIDQAPVVPAPVPATLDKESN